MAELEYWLIDKDGRAVQACDTMSWAEAQKAFWQRTSPERGAYTIRAAPKTEKLIVPEHPRKSWKGRK